MQEEIISLAKKFIAIKSIPKYPEALEEILELALSELDGFTIERFERNGTKSALVYNVPTRPEKFKLILNAHLDVIPGKDEQYVPEVKGDRLYGVGAMDMKANVACLIVAFRDVARTLDYPIALQLVTDEEVGGFDGTKYQVEQGVNAEFVLAAEPTNFDIVRQAKGVLWLKIHIKGITAHGAYPWRGENAVLKANDFLNALKVVYPIPREQEWVTTVNVSSVETDNQTFNKIPDSCIVGLDIRSIPEDAEYVLAQIEKILPEGSFVEVLAEEPALDTARDNPFIALLSSIGKEVLGNEVVLRGAQGSSDARHFRSVGCPGIEFGPIGEGIGSDDEWVDIPSLQKYVEIIKRFFSSLEE